VVVVPLLPMVPEPPTTTPPVGPASASGDSSTAPVVSAALRK